MFIFGNSLLLCALNKRKEGEMHDTVLDPSRLSFSLVGKEIKQMYDERSGEMLTEILFPT